MADTKTTRVKLERRRRRVRAKVRGTAERPRLCVTRSNQHVYAQLVDDDNGVTLVSASSIDGGIKSELEKGSDVEAARAVGRLLGERATEAGFKSVVFDRAGRLYHGRVQAVAEGARKAGLEF
jgi:large subunit ribosomal protein L18